MVKKRGIKILWILILMVVLIIVYFNIPYSPMKVEFNKKVSLLISGTKKSTELFTNEDIKDLPIPVKKYFVNCGYIGTPKMEYMKAVYKDVDFLLSPDKPYSKIDYIQYNFVQEPVRLAFIDTSMCGIPFQGVDSYLEGNGGMKGIIAKTFPLFNEMGSEMNTACLVTILSECLIVPTIALQDYIVWENVDDTHAKATITYYGISASGTFTFAENGEMISFQTSDRWAIETNGTKIQTPWSIILSNYVEKDGIRQPTNFKVVWHYKNSDSIYFNSENATIEYY